MVVSYGGGQTETYEGRHGYARTGMWEERETRRDIVSRTSWGRRRIYTRVYNIIVFVPEKGGRDSSTREIK